MRFLVMPLLILFSAGSLATAAEPVVVIKNATIETMTSAGRLERSTIILRDGKIEAVGKDLKIPDGARVIDAEGGTVMPGIIDPAFEVSIAAASNQDEQPRTIVIRGRTVTLPGGRTSRGGYTRIADNFYPYDRGFRALPRVGLTTLNVVADGIGQAAQVQVTPESPESMLEVADTIAFASVANQSDSLDQLRQRLGTGGGPAGGRFGGRGGFGGGRGGPGGGPPTGGPPAGGPPRGPGGPSTAANPSVQFWRDVAEGKTPLLASVSNAASVLHLLRILDSNKNVKVIFRATGESFYEAIDSLKGRKVSAILRPTLELIPNSRDRLNAARLLYEAGVPFAFSLSDGPNGSPDSALASQEFPLFAVAMMVKGGLPRRAALEALTRQPATMLGLDKTHGTLEPGKTADLLLFTGDPLDPTSRLRLTLIDGRTVHEN